jgi:small subunit ribosomal protein S3
MKEKLFVEQAIKRVELERFLKNQLQEAGFTKSEIVKTPLVTRIVVNVTRPGLAIGKSGQNIKSLTDAIQKNYGIENPQLEIREIQNPNLDAAAVSNKLKALIERGYSWRSVAYKTLKDIMGSGAQGVEIIVSGKLQGKGGRKKKQRIAAGYMKKVGYQTRLVDYAKAAAYPKQGAIGIKVRIVKPDTQFADKIEIMQFLEQRKKAAEAGQKAPEAAVAAPSAAPAAAQAGKIAESGVAEIVVEVLAQDEKEKIAESAKQAEEKRKKDSLTQGKANAKESKAEHKESETAENKGKKAAEQKENKGQEHKAKKENDGKEHKKEHGKLKEKNEKGDGQ